MAMFIEKANLTYVSVPKCACSSLKRAFHEVNTGEKFRVVKIDGKKRSVHNAYGSPAFRVVEKALRTGEYKGDLMAVLRNPIDRLVSCYTHKVVRREWLKRVEPGEMAKRGLSPEPDFEAFVERLADYQAVSPVILRHSRPLTFFLGAEPKRYARLFDMAQLPEFIALVNARAGTQVALGHKNKSKQDMEPVVSAQVAKKIDEVFATDHDVFGAYFNASRKELA